MKFFQLKYDICHKFDTSVRFITLNLYFFIELLKLEATSFI